MEQEHPTGPTFDTLKAAEALQQAGFTGVQARAVTQTIVEAQDNLASKADIRELRAESKADLKELRTEMKAEFKSLRAEMASQQADTKAEFKSLRADFKVLQAGMKSLKESVDSLKSLVMYVVLPLVMGAILISLTVFGFVMTRIPPG